VLLKNGKKFSQTKGKKVRSVHTVAWGAGTSTGVSFFKNSNTREKRKLLKRGESKKWRTGVKGEHLSDRLIILHKRGINYSMIIFGSGRRLQSGVVQAGSSRSWRFPTAGLTRKPHQKKRST